MIAGGLCVWTVTASTEVRTPLTSRSATLTHLTSDSSWQTRLTTWRGTAQMLASRPLAGFGLGLYPGIQATWTHQGRLLTPQTHPSLSEEAHNFYLQTAAETGFVGLSLYVTALAAFAVLGLRRLKQSGPHLSRRTVLVIAALSMLAGQCVDALASPSWQFAEVSLLFWAALGVGMSALQHTDAEPAAASFPQPLRRAGQAALAGAIAVLLAAQVLPLGLLSPVEAYTPPPGWTLVQYSAVLQASALTASVGDTITYTLTAVYNDSQGGTHLVNVSADATASYFAIVFPDSSTLYGTLTKSTASNTVTYTVPEKARGKNLTITGNFKSQSLGVSATTTLAVS